MAENHTAYPRVTDRSVCKQGWAFLEWIITIFQNNFFNYLISKAAQYKTIRETLAAKVTARVSRRRRESRNSTEETAQRAANK
jgi:hypothetical protein